MNNRDAQIWVDDLMEKEYPEMNKIMRDAGYTVIATANNIHTSTAKDEDNIVNLVHRESGNVLMVCHLNENDLLLMLYNFVRMIEYIKRGGHRGIINVH